MKLGPCLISLAADLHRTSLDKRRQQFDPSAVSQYFDLTPLLNTIFSTPQDPVAPDSAIIVIIIIIITSVVVVVIKLFTISSPVGPSRHRCDS